MFNPRHHHSHFPDPGIFVLTVLLHISAATAAPIVPLQNLQTPSLKIQQTINLKRDDLKVQLKECRKENKKTVCTLYLSSKKDDLTLWIADPNREKSRLIDFDGNEYLAFEVIQFGKPETGTVLVKKTPIKLILSFSNLPEQLSRVALLEVGLETYGHEIPVRFRKVDFLSASAPSEKPKPVKSETTPKVEKTPTEPPDSEPPTEEENPDENDPSDDTQPPNNTEDQTKTEEKTQPSQLIPKSSPKQPPAKAPSPAPSTPETGDQDTEEQTEETQPDEAQSEEEQTEEAQPDEEQDAEEQTEEAQPDEEQDAEEQDEDAQPDEMRKGQPGQSSQSPAQPPQP